MTTVRTGSVLRCSGCLQRVTEVHVCPTPTPTRDTVEIVEPPTYIRHARLLAEAKVPWEEISQIIGEKRNVLQVRVSEWYGPRRHLKRVRTKSV